MFEQEKFSACKQYVLWCDEVSGDTKKKKTIMFYNPTKKE